MIVVTFQKNPLTQEIDVLSWFHTTRELGRNIKSIPGVTMIFYPDQVPYGFYAAPNQYKYYDGRLVRKS
ncbi:hypothetical protein [uncultured Holdemanella sp.]|jgi:hypothetical protein|uniref:hypothetical protein n=1 Tax=uncultured Holdemanella sp. TaxID=1763549 RepID=UPI0025D80387|nr:hypothetical protein [uncultured Holdemanella sp.]